MNIDNVVKQLVRDEGIELKPYYCPAGYLTIGIGRNLETNGLSKTEMLYLLNDKDRKERIEQSPGEDNEQLFLDLVMDFKKYGISKEEAYQLCINDVNSCITDLERNLKWFNNSPQELKEVLINMCFNMGIKTLLTFKNTLFYMSVGEYERASVNMLKSKWRKQVKGRAIRLAKVVASLETK